MKLLGLTVLLYFITGYSWLLNTLFFDPSSFLTNLMESKVHTVAQHDISKEQPTPKKIEIKTIKPEEPEKKIVEEPGVQENEINTWYIPNEEINKNNEPDIDSLLDLEQYEEIVFNDVFDSWYRDEN